MLENTVSELSVTYLNLSGKPIGINHLVTDHVALIVQHAILIARNYGGAWPRYVRKATWDFPCELSETVSHRFFRLCA